MKNKAPASATAPALSNEQLMDFIRKQAAEIEALKAAKSQGAVPSMSVHPNGQLVVNVPSGKGTIAFRYYSWHWEAVLKMADEIKAFIKANRKDLKTEEQFRSGK